MPSTADTSKSKIRGLTIPLCLRNPPQSLSIALGHLDLVRKHLRSTKKKPYQPSLTLASLRSSTPSLWDSLDPTSLDCPPFIHTFSRDESAASDLTGQLPVESRRGNKYILITVFRGYIHFTPQKSKSASDYVSSFASILAFFTAHSQPLPSLIVDNETSLECTPVDKTWIQQVVGSLLFYAGALDLSLITAVCQLPSHQSTPTQHDLSSAHRPLSYAQPPQNHPPLFHGSLGQHRRQLLVPT
jgi:hypothetical protein